MFKKISDSHRWLSGVAVAVLMVIAVGCDSPTDPSEGSEALFRVRACGDQHFTVQINDPAVIQRAEQLAGRADQPILNGALVRGTGGFNSPWSWHLDPDSIEFADVTTEVCDGCPMMLEQNLAYWINSVGRFCPWTSRVVRRVR